MKEQDNNLDEKISKSINGGKVEFDFEGWKSKNPEAVKALQAVAGSSSAKSSTKKLNLWRMIMRSPITKLAAAAVIILAVVLGIPFFGPSSQSVTLAGVYEKIQLIDAFTFKTNMVMTGNIQPGIPSGPVESRGTSLISNEYGMRIDMHIDMSVAGQKMNQHQQMYMLPQEKKMYTIMPDIKQYIEMEFNDELLERMKKQGNDPRDMVKQILNCQYTELGKSTINDIEVEGFETTDPAYAGGMAEDVKVTLWVDVESWLPVRVEMDMKMNEQIQMEGVMDDFVWGLRVDASEFVPVIPPDYTTILPGGFKMPSFNEETAIEGLRFFADSMGKYPEKLDMMTLTQSSARSVAESVMSPIIQQKGDVNNLSQEQTQKIREIMQPTQSLMGFYMMLVQDKKEPVYYGDVVSPGEADKVLLRWKTGENEYRVIYGDLSAETVDGQVLAELESQIEQ